jgi:hypothetical protein
LELYLTEGRMARKFTKLDHERHKYSW